MPSQPSSPGLLERVILMLVTWLANELPAMIVCRHRVGKGQSHGIGSWIFLSALGSTRSYKLQTRKGRSPATRFN